MPIAVDSDGRIRTAHRGAKLVNVAYTIALQALSPPPPGVVAGHVHVDAFVHSARVAAETLRAGGGPEHLAVAWLHDVVRSTMLDFDDFGDARIPQTVCNALRTISLGGPGEDTSYPHVVPDDSPPAAELAEFVLTAVELDVSRHGPDCCATMMRNAERDARSA